MKKQGFTLIELLAVIVILAVIALIAIPVITNVIEKARVGAAEASASGYIDAVEKQIAINLVKNENIISDNTYNINDLKKFGVTVKGDEPTTGVITIENKNVSACSLQINDYLIICNMSNGELKFNSTKEKLPTINISFANEIYQGENYDISKNITVTYDGDGSYACVSDLDGEFTNTNSLSIGSHNITCTATSTIGLNSSITSKIIVRKRTIGDEIMYLKSNGDSTLMTDDTINKNIRYVGRTVNNYIKIGTELYRIIGIMNMTLSDGTSDKLVKLVRASMYSSSAYGSNNTWSTSNIKKLLENNYYSTYLSAYDDKIANVKWYTGPVNHACSTTSITSYTQEKTNNTSGKIALINASDFGLASNSNSCRTTTLTLVNGSCITWYNDYCQNTSWIWLSYEWLLSPKNGTTNYALQIRSDAVVNNFSTVSETFQYRPAIYIYSDLGINSGTGTSSDPYILE